MAAGNKSYAAAVVKLLDPTGKLFGPRVIAQGAERVEDMQVDQSKSFMQVGACKASQKPMGWCTAFRSSCGWKPRAGAWGLGPKSAIVLVCTLGSMWNWCVPACCACWP